MKKTLIYQPFLEKRKRRVAILLVVLMLCVIGAVSTMAMVVTGLTVAGLGGYALPFAFGFVILFEIVRYFFYRSFFLQQMARIAAWHAMQLSKADGDTDGN